MSVLRLVACLVVGVLVLTPLLALASDAFDDTGGAVAKHQSLRHDARVRTASPNLTAAVDLGGVSTVVLLPGRWLADERTARPSEVPSAIFVPPRR